MVSASCGGKIKKEQCYMSWKCLEGWVSKGSMTMQVDICDSTEKVKASDTMCTLITIHPISRKTLIHKWHCRMDSAHKEEKFCLQIWPWSSHQDVEKCPWHGACQSCSSSSWLYWEHWHAFSRSPPGLGLGCQSMIQVRHLKGLCHLSIDNIVKSWRLYHKHIDLSGLLLVIMLWR